LQYQDEESGRDQAEGVPAREKSPCPAVCISIHRTLVPLRPGIFPRRREHVEEPALREAEDAVHRPSGDEDAVPSLQPVFFVAYREVKGALETVAELLVPMAVGNADASLLEIHLDHHGLVAVCLDLPGHLAWIDQVQAHRFFGEILPLHESFLSFSIGRRLDSAQRNQPKSASSSRKEPSSEYDCT